MYEQYAPPMMHQRKGSKIFANLREFQKKKKKKKILNSVTQQQLHKNVHIIKFLLQSLQIHQNNSLWQNKLKIITHEISEQQQLKKKIKRVHA